MVSTNNQANEILVRFEKIPEYIEVLRKYFETPVDKIHSIFFQPEISNDQQIDAEIKQNIIKWGLNLKQEHKKGTATVVWIQPRFKKTSGRLSETFLNLVTLNYVPDELKNKILNPSSDLHLVKNWRLAGKYHDPFFDFSGKIDDLDNIAYPDKLSYIPITYNDDSKLEVIPLEYYVPKKLLPYSFTGEKREAERGGRVKREKLLEWNLISENNELTELGRNLLFSFKSSVLYEWWLGYFYYFYEEGPQDYDELFEKFGSFLPKIPLRAFLEVQVHKNLLTNIKIPFIELKRISKLSKNKIIEIINRWKVKDYPCEMCLDEDGFNYPPPEARMMWISNEQQLDRFQKKIPFQGRKQKLEGIKSFLKGNDKILFVHGESGVGKTRLILEAGLKNKHHNFCWLLPEGSFKWNKINRDIADEQAVLVVDDIHLRENWTQIFEEFSILQSEFKNKYKLIAIFWNPAESILTQKHAMLDKNERIPSLEIKPFSWRGQDAKDREDFFALLEGYGLPIGMIDEIIINSQGYPDAISEAVDFFERYADQSADFDFKIISDFDKRMSLKWNDPPIEDPPKLLEHMILDKEERNFLLKFALIGFISTRKLQSRFNDETDDFKREILESLIQKNILRINGETLEWTRSSMRNWVIKNQWVENEAKFLFLNELIKYWAMYNPRWFARAINILRNFFSLKTIQRWLYEISNWGLDKDLFIEEAYAFYSILPILNPSLDMYLSLSLMDPSLTAIIDKPKSKVKYIFPGVVDRLLEIWFEELEGKNFENVYLFQSFYWTLYFLNEPEKILQFIEKVIDLKRLYPEIEIKTDRLELFRMQILFESGEPESIRVKLIQIIENLNSDNLNILTIAKMYLGDVYTYKLKKYPEALEIYNDALELINNSGNRLFFIELINKIGFLFHHYSFSTEIKDSYWDKIELAKQWAKDLKLTRLYAGLVVNIYYGFSEYYSGNLIDEINDAIQKAKANESWYLVGDLYHCLGEVFRKNQKFKKSIEAFENAIEYTNRAKVKFRIGRTYYQLGVVVIDLSESVFDIDKKVELLNKAAKAFEEAKNFFSSENEFGNVLDSIDNLMYIAEKMWDLKKARVLCEEAIILSKSKLNNYKLAEMLIYLIGLLIETGKISDCQKHLNEISNENLSIPHPLANHLKLLEIIISFKNEEYGTLLNKIQEFSDKFVNFDIRKNIFEIHWLFKAIEFFIENGYEKFASELINALCENYQIRDAPFEKISGLVRSELLNDHLQRSKKLCVIYSEYPEWAKFILDQITKPQEILLNPLDSILLREIEANGVEMIDEKKFNETIDLFRHYYDKQKTIHSKSAFFIYSTRLLDLIKSIENIRKLFNFFRHVLDDNSEIYVGLRKPIHVAMLKLAENANSYGYFEDVEKILDYYFNLTKNKGFFEETKEIFTGQIISALNAGKNEKALNYIIKALDFAEKVGFNDFKAKILFHKALCLEKLENFEAIPEVLNEIKSMKIEKEDEIVFDYFKIIDLIREGNLPLAQIKLLDLVQSNEHESNLNLTFIVARCLDYYLSNFDKEELEIDKKLLRISLDLIEKNQEEIGELIGEYERIILYISAIMSNTVRKEPEKGLDFINDIKRAVAISRNKNNVSTEEYLTKVLVDSELSYALWLIENNRDQSLIEFLTKEIEDLSSKAKSEHSISLILMLASVLYFRQKNYSKSIFWINEGIEIISPLLKEESAMTLEDKEKLNIILKYIPWEKNSDFSPSIFVKRYFFEFVHLKTAVAQQIYKSAQLQEDKTISELINLWIISSKLLIDLDDFFTIHAENLSKNSWGDLLLLFADIFFNHYKIIEAGLSDEIQTILDNLSNLNGWKREVGKFLALLWNDSTNMPLSEIDSIISSIIEVIAEKEYPSYFKNYIEFLSKFVSPGYGYKKQLRIDRLLLIDQLEKSRNDNHVEAVVKCLFDLAKIELNLNDYAKSIAYCDELISISSGTLDDFNLNTVHIMKGNAFLEQGIYDQAEQIFKNYVQNAEKYPFQNFLESSILYLNLLNKTNADLIKKELDLINDKIQSVYKLTKFEKNRDFSNSQYVEYAKLLVWVDLAYQAASLQLKEIFGFIWDYLFTKVELHPDEKIKRDLQPQIIEFEVWKLIFEENLEDLNKKLEFLGKTYGWGTYWTLLFVSLPRLISFLTLDQRLQINSHLIPIITSVTDKNWPNSKCTFEISTEEDNYLNGISSPYYSRFFLGEIYRTRQDFFTNQNKLSSTENEDVL